MIYRTCGETLELLAQRAIWWKRQSMLIVADTHFGKAQHFRKSGLAIPQKIFDKDLTVLNYLLVKYEPKNVLILGDLFHSAVNSEVYIFEVWRKEFYNTRFILVKGNHDVFSKNQYVEMNLEPWEIFEMAPFTFSHQLPQNIEPNKFIFSGHIHPGILLKGKGRLQVRLSCFYFTENFGLLPAFGNFTGLELISPQKHAKVFAIVENKVIEV
jgi:DNA ligase-associated metallophosphoesterase